MTIEQFWNDDPKLIKTYYKTYMQKLHQEAHIYGYYQFRAFTTAFNNFLKSLDGKKDPEQYMGKPLIYAEDYFKEEINEETINTEYKKRLAHQVNWVNALSHNQ